MKKINIARLLISCPKGTKLYSPIFGGGDLIKVTNRIHVKFPKENNVKLFRNDGTMSDDGEVMLFPSNENRDWSTFQKSLFTDRGLQDTIGILMYNGDDDYPCKSLNTNKHGYLRYNDGIIIPINLSDYQLEEKQKLFQAIKNNGYKWNKEKKILEKIIFPKFKTGDKIKHKDGEGVFNIIEIMNSSNNYVVSITDERRCVITKIPFLEQENYNLISANKFDVSTLKPFGEVLIRDSNTSPWECNYFSSYNPNDLSKFHCMGVCSKQCIPYEGNEHLRGKTDDCLEYYKTWEE